MSRERLHEIPVKMFEWKIAGPDSLLFTEGLGPCIGLALWDPETKKGLLGHWAAAVHEEPDIREAMSSFVSPGNLTVNAYLRGGEIDGDEFGEKKLIRDSRKVVLKLLSLFGIATEKIDTQWSKGPGSSVSMWLSVDTGKFTSISEI